MHVVASIRPSVHLWICVFVFPGSPDRDKPSAATGYHPLVWSKSRIIISLRNLSVIMGLVLIISRMGSIGF